MTPESRQKKRKSRWSSGIISRPKKKKTLEKQDEAGKMDSAMDQDSAKSSPSKSPVPSASDVNIMVQFCVIFAKKIWFVRLLKFCKPQET